MADVKKPLFNNKPMWPLYYEDKDITKMIEALGLEDDDFRDELCKALDYMLFISRFTEGGIAMSRTEPTPETHKKLWAKAEKHMNSIMKIFDENFYDAGYPNTPEFYQSSMIVLKYLKDNKDIEHNNMPKKYQRDDKEIRKSILRSIRFRIIEAALGEGTSLTYNNDYQNGPLYDLLEAVLRPLGYEEKTRALVAAYNKVT
jgi:hypothetical protein